ncbi:MAG: hypothetical protein FK732_12185 [Asgard group archaeon]|nr:hypothetical protein [Asgard group archaeon]
MTKDKKELTEEEKLHKKFAVNLYNQTWDLMEKEDRTKEEDDEMIHSAHASRYHWGQIGTPIQFERGEWQISRVYAKLNRADAAIHHAKRCLEICKENHIGDFDIAFAHEGLARAYKVAGNDKEAKKHWELGKKAGEKIAKKEDKDYFMSELEKINI